MGVQSRREREREERRCAILQAAQEVFLEKGYEATTMGQVATCAELSKGTLYLYFPSKYDLFAALSCDFLQVVLDGFEEIRETSLSGRQMVAAMLRRWAEFAAEDIKRFRLAITWVASEEPDDMGSPGVLAHAEMIRSLIEHLVAAILRGEQDGSIARGPEPTTLACQLWASMVGCLLFATKCGSGDEPVVMPICRETFVDSFVELLCASIGAGAKE